VKSQSDFIVLVFGKVLHMALLFLAVRLFTTILNDKEIGNLILLISISSFFSLSLINPVGSYINRELNSWHKKRVIKNKLLNYNYYVLTVSAVATLSPLVLIKFSIGASIDFYLYLFCLGAFLFFNTWNQTIVPSLNMFFHRKAFVLLTLLSISLYLSFSLAIVLFINKSGAGWLLGQALGLGIGFIVSLWYFLIKVVPEEKITSRALSLDGVSKVIGFCLPLSVATLLLWVVANSYKIIIEMQLGAESLAYVGLGLALAASLLGAIESLLMQIFQANFYKSLDDNQLKQNRASAFQELIDNTLPVIAGGVFTLTCMSPFLLRILADSRFSSIHYYMIAGLVIEFFRISCNVIGHAAHSEYKTSLNVTPYFIGSILSMVGVFYAVKLSDWQFPILIAIFVSWVVTFLVMSYLSNKILPYRYPLIKIVRMICFLSPNFLITWLFMERASDIFISLLALTISGFYSLAIVYKIIKRESDGN